MSSRPFLYYVNTYSVTSINHGARRSTRVDQVTRLRYKEKNENPLVPDLLTKSGQPPAR